MTATIRVQECGGKSTLLGEGDRDPCGPRGKFRVSDEKESVSKVSDDYQDIRDDVEAAYDEVYDYYKQFAEESDRGAAVLAAALFEHRLQGLISRRFVNCDEEVRRLFFSFKAKIDLAYALGLYDRKTRNDLYVVKKIRDKFAHSHEPMGFDHQEIAAECRKLDADVQDPDNFREQYLTYFRAAERNLDLGREYEP